MNKFGRYLMWCSLIFGTTSLVRGCMYTGVRANVQFALAGLGLVAYVIGHWTAKASTSQKLQRARSRWWGSSYAFRLSTFLSGAWVVGSYFLQDAYDRDMTLVFAPPIVLALLLIGYTLVVAPPKPKPVRQEAPAMHPGDLAQVSPANEAEVVDMSLEDQAAMLSPAQRQRRMDELIARMKDTP